MDNYSDTSLKTGASDNSEMEAKARSMRVPYVDISSIQIDKEIADISQYGIGG